MNTSIKSVHLALRRGFFGILFAGATASVAVPFLSDNDTGGQSHWIDCFANIEEAVAAGQTAQEANLAVQATLRADQRRREAHELALRQLAVDSRWDDPEQRRWLDGATDQTRAEIDSLIMADSEGQDTSGCLDEF